MRSQLAPTNSNLSSRKARILLTIRSSDTQYERETTLISSTTTKKTDRMKSKGCFGKLQNVFTSMIEMEMKLETPA